MFLFFKVFYYILYLLGECKRLVVSTFLWSAPKISALTARALTHAGITRVGTKTHVNPHPPT